ncbi:LuxR C-terminal-related transcriptional regulator [Nocardiopsis coralliicola]
MAPRSAPARHNLPRQADAFVGRERDLSDLFRLLAADRAVTLCGVDGIGKTRLALRVAAQATGSFPDGVWLAELGGVAPDGAGFAIAARVAAAVGVTEERWRPLDRTLLDALSARRALIVLDDCTAVRAEAAAFGAALLASCPQVSLLITSAVPVGLSGEAIWRVPPLAVPGEGAGPEETAASEAVRLLLERCGRSAPEEGAPERLAAAARICRALDGIPLAIELAAPWLRDGPPAAAARLAEQCTGGAPAQGPAPRAQVLRTVLEEVHGQLSGPERVLLRRLSVFADWTLEAAEQVCADAPAGAAPSPALPAGGPRGSAVRGERIAEEEVLDLVSALSERSLTAFTREFQGRARYRLPAPVRAFAAELSAASGEEEAVRARHREHVLSIAGQIGTSAVAGRLMPWAERSSHWESAEAEYDDIRAALQWSADRCDVEEGLRLCAGLRPFWGTGYHFTEGMGWCERFLALPGGTAGARARAHAGTAELAWARGDQDVARRHAERALPPAEEAGDTATAHAARNMLALVALRAADTEQADRILDTLIPAARRTGDLWNEAIALCTQATAAARRGEAGNAEGLFNASLMILRGMDHRWGVGVALIAQATAAEADGDLVTADRCYRESLDIQRESGSAPELARCLYGVGRVAQAFGATDQAYDYLAEGLLLSQNTGQLTGVAVGLSSIARAAAPAGEVRSAALLWGAAAGLRARAEPHRPHRPKAPRGDAFGVDAATLAAWLREGGKLTAGDAVELALQVTESGRPRARSAPPALPSPDSPGALRTAAGTDPLAPARPRRKRRVRPAPIPEQAALTPREEEIAFLVAEGLGNRAVADRLSIATATAARHIANINRKLGVTSRLQITEWVRRRGGAGTATAHPD